MSVRKNDMNSLNAVFSPGTVAVVGASSVPGKVGHDIFANILRGGYTGTLYPVNPGSKSILSVRTYPSISEVPEAVDLAIIILTPQATLAAVEEAVRCGVKGMVIVSAGFREVGPAGLQIENRIVSLCREAGVRMIGPNCLGVINPLPAVRLNASFSARMPSPGNISFLSQSGALCTAVLDFAADRDFGFSKFISIGNKADVDEVDLLRYLHEDQETAVIVMYLEELRRGQEFIDVAKEITSGHRPTPVIAVKSGRTAAGARAAASHTGALAGSEAVYDAILKQAGIIRAESIDELFDFANAFTYKYESKVGKTRRRLPRDNRVAIITNAGGPGIIATDVTASSELELARFSQNTIQELAGSLPKAANLNNPVDVIGDAPPDRYERALQTVINDDGVDGILVILTPQSMTNALGTAEAIVRIAQYSPKPILCCFMGIIDVSAGVKYLQENGYPVYKFPENAAKSMAALYRFSRWVNREEIAPLVLSHDPQRAGGIIQDCLKAGKTHLGELEGTRILACYGFNVLTTTLARSDQEAADIADGIGYPVVMKIVSPQILHKSDAGGVVVGVQNRDGVLRQYRAIMENAKRFAPDAELQGVLVQAMAPPGEEVILGANRYAIGPLIMFGIGGIFVEIFRDVAFRMAPLTRNDSNLMVREIKGYRLLTGFRGRPPRDIGAIERMIVSLSDLIVNHPEITEMDINPLIVHEEGRGATVADCRIILGTSADARRP